MTEAEYRHDLADLATRATALRSALRTTGMPDQTDRYIRSALAMIEHQKHQLDHERATAVRRAGFAMSAGQR